MCSKVPRRSWFSSIIDPTNSLGTMIEARTYGSSATSMSPAAGIWAGLCTSTVSPVEGVHLVGDVGRGDQQVEVVLPLQPLAHDVHVQQAEEAAAEAEPERLRRLRLVRERGVVQLQLLQRVAQLRVLVGVGREQPGEHHRLDVLVARQRLRGARLLQRQRVAHRQLGDVLEPGHDVAHLAGRKVLGGAHAGREEAQLLDLEARALRHRAHRVAAVERAVDHPHEGEHAAVLVVRGVEDQRPRRRLRVALRRRDAVDDGLEHLGHARGRSWPRSG